LSKDRIDEFEAIWNENLQRCLAITVIICCEEMSHHVEYKMRDLMNLWPMNSKLKIFENEFYKQVFNYDRNIRLFKSKINKLYSINQCKLLKLSFLNYDVQTKAKKILQKFHSQSSFVINIPNQLVNYLNMHDVKLKNQINDLEFCEVFITNINSFSTVITFNLLNYILKECACNKDGSLNEMK
jgi:hypothetical protein